MIRLNLKPKTIRRIVSAVLCLTFSVGTILPPTASWAQVMPSPVAGLPPAGMMVTPSAAFNPPVIQGMTVYPQNPMEFDFVISAGDQNLQDAAFETEAKKLIKYFLAALTVPEQELWVNLSPYEKDRIIPKAFGITEMGRDLLAQDYLLKQLTASLMYPEDELGKKFWDRVYTKAREMYGTTEIPLNTFNKVWIVPDKAVVMENGNSVYVVESHLKVMLEEDYAALAQNAKSESLGTAALATKDVKAISGVTSGVVRDVLIPELEREVNSGKTFANLRQVFNSLILATWYKQNLKNSLLNQIYADQNKVKGVEVADKTIKDKIYAQYVAALNKGVYNYIKEDYDPLTKQNLPRKYFSGGVVGDFSIKAGGVQSVSSAQVTPQQAGNLPGESSKSVQVSLAGVGAEVVALAAGQSTNGDTAGQAESRAQQAWGGELWQQEKLAQFLKDGFNPNAALKQGPIFVPRAVVPNEARTGLTPHGIAFLRAIGVKNPIYVEAGSGVNRYTKEVYFSDEQYQESGAEVLEHDAFVAKAQAAVKKVVVSIKEPQESEYPILKNALLFTYLHLADNPALTKKLQELLLAGVAYETITVNTPQGIQKIPVLAPASIAAASMSVRRYAAWVRGKEGSKDEAWMEREFRESAAAYSAEREDVQQTLSGKTVFVLGGGVAGEQAAFDAARRGAKVYITEVNDNRIAELNRLFKENGIGDRITVLKRDVTKKIDGEYLDELLSADAVIGAILIEGAKAPVEIDHALYLKMRDAGKLRFVADIAIDQGGNIAVFPGKNYSHGYKYQDGWIVLEGGVGLFSVTNMPSAVPLQVSLGLEQAKLAYLVALLMGPQKAVEVFPELKGGFNVVNGQVTHPKVAAAPGINAAYVPVEEALTEKTAAARGGVTAVNNQRPQFVTLMVNKDLQGLNFKDVEAAIASGKMAIAEVSVDWAQKIKKTFPQDAFTIFISPLSEEQIRERMVTGQTRDKIIQEEALARQKERAKEKPTPEDKQKARAQAAVREMSFQDEYDVVIVNNNLKDLAKDAARWQGEEGALVVEQFMDAVTKARAAGKKLILYSGPSATGKTPLWNQVQQRYGDRFSRIVLYTTRDIREGEAEGIDYYFRSAAELERLAEGFYVPASIDEAQVAIMATLTKARKEIGYNLFETDINRERVVAALFKGGRVDVGEVYWGYDTGPYASREKVFANFDFGYIQIGNEENVWKKLERPEQEPVSYPDAAGEAKVSEKSTTAGGIDFNAALWNLEVRRDKNGVPAALPQAPIPANIKIDGLVPVIINIVPVTNLPFILGADELKKGERKISLPLGKEILGRREMVWIREEDAGRGDLV